MSEAILLLVVATLPALFIRKYIASPFGVVGGITTIMFVLKYLFNTWMDIPFLSGLGAQEIAPELRLLAWYLAGGFVVAIGVAYCCRALAHDTEPPSYRFELSPCALPLNFLIIGGLVLAALLLGVNPIQNPLGFRRFLEGQGMYYFFSLALFLAYLNTIYAAYRTIILHERISGLQGVSAILSVGFCLSSGLINTLVLCFVLPMLFLYLCGRRRFLIILLLIAPIAGLYVRIYSVYRDSNLSSTMSLSEAVDAALLSDQAAALFSNRFDYLENFTSATAYLRHKQPDYGASLSSAFVQFVPRAFWKSKPEVFSTTMTKILVPSMYDEAGSTANFGAMNEFLSAFGPSLGMIIGTVFFGVVLGFAQVSFMSAQEDTYRAVQYLLVVFPFVVTGFIAGFVADLALPLLVLNCLYFRLLVRRVDASAPASAPAVC